MEHKGKPRGGVGLLGLVAATALLLAAPGTRAAVNTGNVNFNAGMDFTTAYFFRGILQERNGFIWQPHGEIDYHIYKNENGLLTDFTIYAGNWNSIQSEKTLASGHGPGNWYEADIWAGLQFGFYNTLTFRPFYYVYTYPNGAFPTVQEMDLLASLNDAQWLGPFALNPSVLMAWEIQNTALGSKEGTYAEVDINPNWVVLPSDTYPVTLALPMQVGMSVSDYYDAPHADQGFGFYKGGATLSVPLAFIPEKYGSWSVAGGAAVYVFNSNLKELNKGNNPWVVGTWSLNWTY